MFPIGYTAAPTADKIESENSYKLLSSQFSNINVRILSSQKTKNESDNIQPKCNIKILS